MAPIAALLVLILAIGVTAKRFSLGTFLALGAGICGLLLLLYLGS